MALMFQSCANKGLSWEEMARDQEKQIEKALLTKFVEKLIQHPSETLDSAKPKEA